MAQRQVTVVIVGAGNRGMVYQQFAIEHPDQCKVFLLLSFPFVSAAESFSLPDQQQDGGNQHTVGDNGDKRWWPLRTPWPFAGSRLHEITACQTITSLRATRPSKTSRDSQIAPLLPSTIDFIAMLL